MRVIGFLNSGALGANSASVTGFRQGLKEAGYLEGQNVTIEYRWAEGHYDQLPALATDLVHQNVAVIAAMPGASGVAAKAATAKIPIVFSTGGDPIKEGLVDSINRPGSNVTGVNSLLNAMEGKRLGILRELVPAATLMTVLLNPVNPASEAQAKNVQAAADSVGQKIHIVRASTEREIDAAFATAAQLRSRALLVGADAFFFSQRDQLIASTEHQALPAIFHLREFALAGGLISYGTDIADSYRLAGTYVGRILNGEKPADLPVISPTKFELVINLKTAKALGIDVPPTMLATADEVIE